MSKKLSEIGAELKALRDKLIESAGEVTDADFDAMLNSEDELEKKLDSYVFIIDAYEADAAEQKEKATAATKRAKTATSAAASMKERLKFFLTSQDMKRHKTSNHTFLVATNSAPPLLIDKVDIATLPPCFVKRVEELVIDKSAVEDTLKQGVELYFARYGERGTNLQISK